MYRKILAIVSIVFVLAGCEKDKNPTGPESKTMFKVTIENVSETKMYSASGVFNTPVGNTNPAPIGPGEVYEFSFSAAPGARLSFTTMFVHSNDLFFAPDESGITLFENSGMQVTGDITSQIKLWDAGTEVNQEPGLGADQAPRQAGANTGAADADNTVRLAADDFGNLPAVNDVVKVTLSSTSSTGFTLRIENVSGSNTLQTSDGASHAVPLAPGVWVVHTTDAPLFAAGMPDKGNGLEAIAEDGDPTSLASILTDEAGIFQLIAPGVWATHMTSNLLFTAGEADKNYGLEALAEDGNPADLATYLSNKNDVLTSDVFNTPVGASSPAPVGPGASYEFSFEAASDEYLSLATMLVQTNDLFYAPNGMGIMLFDNSGSPISGDITSQFKLWDAGTEVNEEPGVGLNQAPRQSGANSGMDENGLVQLVNDGYTYPNVSEVLRVKIERQ
jgi:hypothetical protein